MTSFLRPWPRIASAAFAAAVLLALASPATPVSLSADSTALSVALLVPNGQDIRWQQDAQTFVQELRRRDAKAGWLVLNAHNSEAEQIQQAQEAVDGGARVLVVSPVDPDSAGAIVAYARSRGVRVIAYDRPIEARQLTLFIGFNPFTVGRLQGEYILSQVPSGYLVQIDGPFDDDLAQS